MLGTKDICDEDLFGSAEKALMSGDHMAKTAEELERSSQRRIKTVDDMEYYWKIVSEKSLPTNRIHITGTKGKGTTAWYCDYLLRTKYKCTTGLFTSPHLVTIRERIRINGQPISEQMFGYVYWTLRHKLELAAKDNITCGIPVLPGYFKMLTLMSMYTFAEYHSPSIDVVIFEVGMGGRYDATNLSFVPSNNTVCGVTLIDYDHTHILGNTLEKIAWEKGGLFFPNSSCYIMPTNQPSVQAVLQQCAEEKSASSYQIVQNYDNKGDANDKIPQHLQLNWNMAQTLCRSVLQQNNDTIATIPFPNHNELIWPGRCQTVPYNNNNNVKLFLDGAHTPASMVACQHWLQSVLSETKIFIFYCGSDRNPIPLLKPFINVPWDEIYFISKLPHTRPSRIPIYSVNHYLQDAKMKTIFNIGDEVQSWSATLRCLWEVLTSTIEDRTNSIFTGLDVPETLHRISSKCNDNSRVSVAITGSLYLIGTVLETIDWSEPSASGFIHQYNFSTTARKGKKKS